jgi:acetyl-CoA C-acetyltransferase
MPTDPRTPVIAGVAQVTHRPLRDDPTTWTDPLALMGRALERAGADAAASGRSTLLDRVDVLTAVPSFVWTVPDPGRAAADAVGVRATATKVAFAGGTVPQSAVFDAARRIADGELDVAVVVGAEAIKSRDLARRADRRVAWPEQDESTVAAPVVFELGADALRPAERDTGLALPVITYALFEHALRRSKGWTRTEHVARLDAISSRMASVAADNPDAWYADARDVVHAAEPTPANRMVSAPYTKLLASNVVVDMAAAVIVCSLDAARRAGVPDDRLVFPLVGATAREQWFVTERDELSTSVAMRACAAALLGAGSGRSVDDIEHLDLYSCFPVAVQLAGDALGIDVVGDERPPTVTGGMTFFGGPGNNYVTHSLAAMASRLRGTPGTTGLVTGLGWYASTHSWGLYSTTPASSPFEVRDVQGVVDAVSLRRAEDDFEGDGEIESYTVPFDRDGSTDRAVFSIRTPSGSRRVLAVTDAELAAATVEFDPLGEAATVRDGRVTFR